MTAIAYDLPVRNMIAGLDATKHVSHVQHRKTHVTLHHNGGWLTHDGILSVWKTRPASAHFNSDDAGTIAQFVRINEYAWACGSTEGNQRSISIEMCNQTGAPAWVVGEETWRSAARLAGWLFARVIGYRPTSEFLVMHKHWSSTECAGPWIARMYPQILALAQRVYDNIVSGQPVEEVEEDDMQVYQVPGGIFDKEPDWLTVMVPPVRESSVLPDNGTSAAFVALLCPQYPVEIWGVYRVFNGGSELLWGPGFDPRSEGETIPPTKSVELPADTYKYFKLDKKGTIGLSVLYEGDTPLNALVTLAPKGF